MLALGEEKGSRNSNTAASRPEITASEPQGVLSDQKSKIDELKVAHFNLKYIIPVLYSESSPIPRESISTG